jgi:hypothetical protein
LSASPPYTKEGALSAEEFAAAKAGLLSRHTTAAGTKQEASSDIVKLRILLLILGGIGLIYLGYIYVEQAELQQKIELSP